MTHTHPATAKSELSCGAEIELTITDIAHGGITIARHHGRVVFVADAIPGETVLARITDTAQKSFARASVTRVLAQSPDRVQHIWPQASLDCAPEARAGGAEFGHIALPRQRQLKAEVLSNALTRFGGMQFSPAQTAVAPVPGDVQREGLAYRSRVRLHVDPDTGLVGPYAARSRRVIQVSDLPLATAGINQVAPLAERFSGVTNIDLLDPSGDDPRMLITAAGERSVPGAQDLVREVVNTGAGAVEFVVRAGGFWQVHRQAPAVLFAAIQRIISELLAAGEFDPQAANLDLYGGAGLLAAAMAQASGGRVKVSSIESAAEASDAAAENLAAYVGARALSGRVDRHLAELLQAGGQVRERLRRGTVVLDPPRSGAGRVVLQQLSQLAPRNIVYVACDPVALARDTKTLCATGYVLREISAHDLFPHTHHFESLAVFSRG